MGQRPQFDGQILGAHDAVDVIPVSPRANQPFHEAVGLAQLEAHVVGGSAQRVVADIGGPEIKNILFQCRQARALARAQGLEGVLDPRALPLQLRAVVFHALINDGQIVGVVQKAAFGIHFCVDARPESDGRFQFRRPGQQV